MFLVRPPSPWTISQIEAHQWGECLCYYITDQYRCVAISTDFAYGDSRQ